jgi:hypothetical protein
MAATISRGDLRHNVLVETGADRMGALGRSDALGAALWRVTADMDVGALIQSAVLLARRVRRGRESWDAVQRMCGLVVREWLECQCSKCGGRGYMTTEAQVQHACTLCEGSGRRRHSDAERCRGMGIDKKTYAAWEPRFAAAHAVLADSNVRVRRDAARQLERGARA